MTHNRCILIPLQRVRVRPGSSQCVHTTYYGNVNTETDGCSCLLDRRHNSIGRVTFVLAVFRVVKYQLGVDVLNFFGRLVVQMTLVDVTVAARTLPFSTRMKTRIPFTFVENLFTGGAFPETLTLGGYDVPLLVSFLLLMSSKANPRYSEGTSSEYRFLDSFGCGTRHRLTSRNGVSCYRMASHTHDNNTKPKKRNSFGACDVCSSALRNVLPSSAMTTKIWHPKTCSKAELSFRLSTRTISGSTSSDQHSFYCLNACHVIVNISCTAELYRREES